ncbi:hypothetical protein JCM17380_33240 [Desulfosporosinus burensis]
MDKKKSQQLILNVLLILFSAICYYLATKFVITRAPGRLGPDFWPKMLCILIIVFSVADIVMLLLNKEKHDSTEEINPAEDADVESSIKKYPLFLIGGMVITGVYIYLLPIIGFIICTALYLAALMLLGQYRNKKVIISSSFVGSFSLLIVFSKIVYISLPAGIGFFGEFTFLLYKMLGVS